MGQNLLTPQALPCLWNENIWDELLGAIKDQQVIPIVGPDLLIMETEAGEISLDRFLAGRLAERLADMNGIPHSALPAEATVNDMVCNFKHREERRESLYRVIKDFVENASFRPPKPLRQLAEISHFNLFVTTNFDLFLEQAINTVRFGGVKRTETISYATNNKEVADLGRDKGEPHQPTVFHLLGQMSSSPRSYVICDQDLLEFVHKLLQQSDSSRPERLFEKLSESYLLILGQNFSDWLARFFLYLAKWSQVSRDRNFLEILADTRTSRDANLVLYLQYFSKKTRVFQGGGAVEFVEELWQRWRERYPVPVASPENLHQYLPPPRDASGGRLHQLCDRGPGRRQAIEGQPGCRGPSGLVRHGAARRWR